MISIDYTNYTDRTSTNYYTVDGQYFYSSINQALLKAALLKGGKKLTKENLQEVVEVAYKRFLNASPELLLTDSGYNSEVTKEKLTKAAYYWL